MPTFRSALSFLFWSILFGISYTQAPLYYSNQNQYFLHGLAEAGRGDLNRDWLANTKDPTPLFSSMVALTARYLHKWFFYFYYLLILGLYFHSLIGLFTFLTLGQISNSSDLKGGMKIPSTKLCFITFFVMLHAGIIRWASARLFGVDYPWFFQAGVAGQYVLGFGLQPSVCGVFLLASILAFLQDRPWIAVFWACLAPVVHATYFPTATFLTLAYMVVRYRTDGLGKAVLLGSFALALVMPALLYNLVNFAPSSAAIFAEAQRILAHIRIPHHAEIARWFDGIAAAQILWMILAMVLVRRSKLFLIMLIPFLGSLLLGLVQLATGNDTLALLFPWRTSVILVPIATTVILTRIVLKLGPWLQTHATLVQATCFRMLGGCLVGGLAILFLEMGYQIDHDELPLLEFVKKNHGRGDVYLIPVELPKTWSGSRGVFSSNFMPAPRSGKAGNFLAIDLQQFRLKTEAPLFVDFKSIPYQDEEVLAWWQRLRWCTEIYAGAEDLRAELSKKGITHVVTPASKVFPFAGLGTPLYQDAAYCLFSVAKK